MLPTLTHIIPKYIDPLWGPLRRASVPALDGNRGDVAVQMRAENGHGSKKVEPTIYQILLLESPYGHIMSRQHHYFQIVTHALCL